MSKLDLVIRNGEIVNATGRQGRANIGILDGCIVQIGGEMEGERELDASARLVIPGGVDAHVHLSLSPEDEATSPHWVDNFESGSCAALAGGITTLGNMTVPDSGETPLEAVERDSAKARKQTIADLFLHPALTEATPRILAEIPKLLEQGSNSIKIFTAWAQFDEQWNGYLEAIRVAGRHGMISLIHCEDYALMKDATDRLVAENKTSLRYYAESRPVISEVLATQRAIAMAEATGAPIYIVHISSGRALEACKQAQERGLPVYVETRPMYLFFTRARLNDSDGAKFVGMPPLREREDIDALWAGLREGTIQTVCTDHAPWMLADKLDPTHTITNVRPGVADLQFMLPTLYSEGVRKGRISLERFVQVTSTNAAKLFGLFPQKGIIAPGSDADLVIFDPELSMNVDSSIYKSNSDFSVFEGWEITGWPVITLRRGEVVYNEGKITGIPGSGRLLSRKAGTSL
jgi:dihydropyrimidinase